MPCVHMLVFAWLCVCVCRGLGECHRVSDLDATHTLRSTLTSALLSRVKCVRVYVFRQLVHSTGAEQAPHLLSFVIFLQFRMLNLIIPAKGRFENVLHQH